MRAPGETPGHVRARVRDGRAGDRVRARPDRAARAQRAGDATRRRGLPFSSRNLVACLREGAERFGWGGRDPAPGVRRDGRWLVGTGVAASTYPATARRPPRPSRGRSRTGRYVVGIAAADIGTGARTVLTQIAADALETGDRPRSAWRSATARCRRAMLAGGSMGTASWGSAIVKAAGALRAALAEAGGEVPARRASRRAPRRPTTSRPRRPLSRHALRRAVRRGPRRRRHRRGARAAAARRVRRAGASSTRSPRARSSSAA